MCLYYVDFVIAVIASFYISSTCYEPIDNGKMCGEGDNLGVCKIITECPSAWKTLKETSENSYQRCGFLDDGTEIICCPDFKNVELRNNMNENLNDRSIWDLFTVTRASIPHNSNYYRKSEAACREYDKSIPITIADRIISGTDTNVGEFPHMAQIGYESQDFVNLHNWECGGSLIHPRFVLTAAHCIERSDGNLPKIVRFGFTDVNLPNDANVIERKIHNCTIHPQYQRTSKVNDIALIELADEVVRTENVYPACLYQTNDDPTDLYITGWGRTISGDDSRILQKANIKPIDTKTCATIYVNIFGTVSINTITSNQICCLINNSMIDTCQGDSGGPLQISMSEIKKLYAIVGVTSYGVGCGDGKTPGIYTRVSSYIDWIENVVWSN